MKKDSKWSEASLREAAAPYSSRSEFAYNNKPAYEAARCSGLLPNLFPLMLRQWDIESVTVEASKYSTRTEFAKSNGSAYNAARRLGIIESLFDSLLDRWTVEAIEKIALSVPNKKALKRTNASAYNAALRLGIIDRLFDNQGSVNARDCVYLWAVSDEPDLYKFGVTSYEMGDFRIRQVAKEASVVPSIVMLERVGFNGAKILEKQMKRIGRPYRFSKKFFGYTEFRYMTPDQVARCVEMVKGYRQIFGV